MNPSKRQFMEVLDKLRQRIYEEDGVHNFKKLLDEDDGLY